VSETSEASGMFEHLGPALVLLRNLRGVKQSELAQMAGIRSSQVSGYESGAVQPQLAQLERLLKGLEVPFEVFLYALIAIGEIQEVVERGLVVKDLRMKGFLQAFNRWLEDEGAVALRKGQDTD